MRLLATTLYAATAIVAASSPVVIPEPSEDRWMYPSNSSPGTRGSASSFSALPDSSGVEDRWGFFLLAFDTTAAVPAGLSPDAYRINSITLRATTGQHETFVYDPTYDSFATYGTPGNPPSVSDSDSGRPVELHGAGFRGSFSGATFTETSTYGFPDRNAYPLGFNASGNPRDVSWNVTDEFESEPWAIGTTSDAQPGESVATESQFFFAIDHSKPGVEAYLRQSLADGKLWLSINSLHPAIQQGGSLADWLTRDDAVHQLFGDLAPQLTVDVDLALPLTIGRTLSGISLSWPQVAGHTFKLQASPDLSSSWTTIHSEAATDSTPGSFLDTTTADRRFYRLEVLPTP